MSQQAQSLSNVPPSPTIAEGDLVRSTNDMYKEYGVGRVQKVRNGQAKIEFNPSVFMEPPYRSENKILPLAEMEKVDTPLERAIARANGSEPGGLSSKMLAARLLTGNKGGQLSNARTEILPHQIFTAHRVVSSPRRRFLLADEVGLGKTIEAGMIWQALHAARAGQANADHHPGWAHDAVAGGNAGQVRGSLRDFRPRFHGRQSAHLGLQGGGHRVDRTGSSARSTSASSWKTASGT